jgi:hypothetical protein
MFPLKNLGPRRIRRGPQADRVSPIRSELTMGLTIPQAQLADLRPARRFRTPPPNWSLPARSAALSRPEGAADNSPGQGPSRPSGTGRRPGYRPNINHPLPCAPSAWEGGRGVGPPPRPLIPIPMPIVIVTEILIPPSPIEGTAHIRPAPHAKPQNHERNYLSRERGPGHRVRHL